MMKYERITAADIRVGDRVGLLTRKAPPMFKPILAAAATLAVAATPAAAAQSGHGPAVPAARHGHLTLAQGRREIAGYEADPSKHIDGERIGACQMVGPNAVRCTVTTPPIAITNDPNEAPSVWQWFDTARPNPGPFRWWNVVSTDPVGEIVL